MSEKQSRRGEGPPTTLPELGGFRIEVTSHQGGVKRVLISACKEIVTYCHDCIVLKNKHTLITITGEELWCRTYSPACAEVLGRVFGIALEEGKHG